MPARHYVVLTRKASGVDVVFTRCPNHGAAARLVAKLQDIGCTARAVPAKPSDVPGLQRRPRGARVPS
jgi:hypothetical protein